MKDAAKKSSKWWRKKVVKLGSVVFAFALISVEFSAEVTQIYNFFFSTPAEKKQIAEQEVGRQKVLSESALDSIETTNFEGFDKIGDIRFNKEGVLSLGYTKKGFAYYLSTKAIFEHAVIEVKFTPLTEASDFYIIVENAFQIIIGDGDRRAISLKSFDVDNPNWNPEFPENCKVTSELRCYLTESFPVDQPVKATIDVNAKIENGSTRSVTLNIKFYDQNGKLFDLNGGQEIVWNFSVNGSFNDKARFGAGLIDPSALNKPKVIFHYLTVKEKLQ